MSEELKDTVKENENVAMKVTERDVNPDVKPWFYTKFMARLTLISSGVLIFTLAFYKATQIVGFNTTKLLLLEVCLFILVLAFICISVVLTSIRHKCTTHRLFALLLYISALFVISLELILWVFFKASSIV